MKQFRLNRLFNASSGRCLDVAVDHGFFGEPSFLAGIEDMTAAIERLVAAAPDAIQLTVGQAPLLQGRPGKGKPALVLRTDVANVYGRTLPDELFSLMIEDAVPQAIRLDAACVVVNLFDLPGQPGVRRACIENILRLKPACDVSSMPLMIEPLVMQESSRAGAYMVDGDVEKIVPLVRQATELGADLIKADPTSNLSCYHRVIEAARVPVLVRGGGRVADEEVLARTVAVLEQGAAGVVYGRNIVQHANPTGMTRALMAVLHAGASAEDALDILRSRVA